MLEEKRQIAIDDEEKMDQVPEFGLVSSLASQIFNVLPRVCGSFTELEVGRVEMLHQILFQFRIFCETDRKRGYR